MYQCRQSAWRVYMKLLKHSQVDLTTKLKSSGSTLRLKSIGLTNCQEKLQGWFKNLSWLGFSIGSITQSASCKQGVIHTQRFQASSEKQQMRVEITFQEFLLDCSMQGMTDLWRELNSMPWSRPFLHLRGHVSHSLVFVYIWECS